MGKWVLDLFVYMPEFMVQALKGHMAKQRTTSPAELGFLLMKRRGGMPKFTNVQNMIWWLIHHFDKSCLGAQRQIETNSQLSNVGRSKRGNSYLSQNSRSSKKQKQKEELEEFISSSTMFMADGVASDPFRTARGSKGGAKGRPPSALERAVSMKLKEYLD